MGTMLGPSGQDRHKFALAAAGRALPAWLLHRMGGVKDNGHTGLLRHCRQAAEIGDQRVIAKTCAAFGHQNIGIAAVDQFGDDIFHIPGGQELTFFHIHHPPGLRRRDQQIGLAAQEGWDLQDIDDIGYDRTMIPLMNIGQHGNFIGVFDFLKHRQRLIQTHAALTLQGGAVRLVIAGLIDQGNPKTVTDFFQLAAHIHRMIAAFHLTGPGDQHERLVIGNFDLAKRDGMLLHLNDP